MVLRPACQICYNKYQGKKGGCMKRDYLIPREKSKKVIHLDPRGRGVGQKHYGAGILYVLAVLCLLYCVGIGLFVSFGSYFFLIWGVTGLLCAAWAWILTHRSIQEKIPGWMRITFRSLVAAGMLFLLILEGMIVSRFNATAEAGADYVIILGAQWRTTGPSYVLQKRLDKAIGYLLANPDTKVIVSGGQGYDEPVSEAEGMKGYLEEAGIDPERILTEDASTNTTQNLICSGELLNKSEDKVVIVTNNFHMFRALAIAKKQGYTHVEGLSAGMYPITVPNNLLREAFGVVKDFMANHL